MNREQNRVLSEIQSSAIEKGWIKRLDKLLLRFIEQRTMLGFDETDWFKDVDAFILWLGERFQSSKGSYDVYKRKFAWYARSLGHPIPAERINSSKFMVKQELKSRSSKVAERSKTKKEKVKKKNQSSLERYDQFTSSAGYKSGLLSKDDVTAFIVHASAVFRNGKRRYRDGAFISGMFELGCMTGIRPIEWFSAYLVPELVIQGGETHKDILVIKGAEKGTGVRSGATGKQRHLSVSHWREKEKELLLNMLELIQVIKGEHEAESEALGTYKKILTRLSSACQPISRAAFTVEGVITLYTGRHLYAAEFRRAQMGDRVMLAAALGHTDILNQKWYGDHFETDEPRQFGWSLARPLEIDAGLIHERVAIRRASKKQILIDFLVSIGEIKRATSLGYRAVIDTDSNGKSQSDVASSNLDMTDLL